MKADIDLVIHSCEAGHFFIEEQCPFCGAQGSKSYPFREGDCVKCGNLCPVYAYGCDSFRSLSECDFVMLAKPRDA
jgi:hypothetical protein